VGKADGGPIAATEFVDIGLETSPPEMASVEYLIF